MEETELEEIMKQLQDMNKYFDKEGKPISFLEWSIRMEDRQYKIIKQENVGDCVVSTVWLGINMCVIEDSPIEIFETMIFLKGKKQEESIDDPFYHWVKRYTTEQQAIEGHQIAISIAKEFLLIARKENEHM